MKTEDEKFIIGPTQEAWLTALEENPEQQASGHLGCEFKDGSKGFCCLGKALEVIGLGEWIPLTIVQTYNGKRVVKKLEANSSTFYLKEHYSLLGLFSDKGTIKYKLNPDASLSKPAGERAFRKKVTSLAHANDYGIPWSEIARFVRAFPETVFSKPV